MLVHYDQSQKILHLVIYKGETLELANTYTANCFKTALYYIFLSLKQTIINPQQTILRVFNTLSQEELQLIEKYFNGTEIINSEDKIIK